MEPNAAPRAASGARRVTLVDGHVHLYDCYDRRAFFDGAAQNFRRAAEGLGVEAAAGCLMLTERATDHSFRSLRERAGEPEADGWAFRLTPEPVSLIAHNGKDILIVIAGRQIVTREGLEVLALATDAEFADGLPLPQAVAAVSAAGAVAVLPWGFAKWWSGRGSLVRKFLRATPADGLFLGDNGGRPRLSRRPPIFAEAEARGFRILPGTDPLPLPAHGRRAGRYGFVLDGELDQDRPAAALKDELARRRGPIRTYGRLESLGPFFASQLMLRMRKLARAGTA